MLKAEVGESIYKKEYANNADGGICSKNTFLNIDEKAHLDSTAKDICVYGYWSQ